MNAIPEEDRSPETKATEDCELPLNVRDKTIL